MGCFQAGSVWALGLGEITLESFLNEPLKARVELLNTGSLNAEQVRVRLATSEDFDRLGVDRAYFLTGIKFAVQLDDSGSGSIVLTSDDPVLEPYLDLIVETRWPSGRLLREYTVLVDPPAFDEEAEIISASQRVEEVEGIPAPSKKNTDPVVTRGDRVDLQQRSALAPGAMPERGFAADTAVEPAPGSRYLIRRDETLWEIAEAARPEGVSVHQTMLDIQRLNPDAFIDGNINRIKAGYIIYLPAPDEISSKGLSEALEEVRQQNEDWRAGRASSPPVTTGPSLRISADPEEEVAPAAEAGDGAAPAGAGGGSAAAALEDLERSQLKNAELQGRMDALAGQVQTLENIVSVKDEQIATLQARLAAAEQTAKDRPQAATGAAPAVSQAAAGAPSGWGENLFYPGIAVVVTALGGLLLWRRRRSDGEASAAADTDIFAGVELREQALEIEEELPPQAEAPVAATLDREALDTVDLETAKAYGQRQHDQYADDVDSGDALAEADIYIAYGRYPQAIELLRAAVDQEPGNAAFRLKLLELYTQVGREADASRELAVLRELGDQSLVARGEEFIAELRAIEGATGEEASGLGAPTVGNPAGVSALAGMPTAGSPAGAKAFSVDAGEELAALEGATLEAAPDFEQHLEESAGEAFSELEIEDDEFAGFDQELDLSEDFDTAIVDDIDDGEDLVFATEGNPVSTKLDLARAYIDMGDEDGARQILDEVVVESSGEHQEEAQALLERIA